MYTLDMISQIHQLFVEHKELAEIAQALGLPTDPAELQNLSKLIYSNLAQTMPDVQKEIDRRLDEYEKDYFGETSKGLANVQVESPVEINLDELPVMSTDYLLDMYNKGEISKDKLEELLRVLETESGVTLETSKILTKLADLLDTSGNQEEANFIDHILKEGSASFKPKKYKPKKPFSPKKFHPTRYRVKRPRRHSSEMLPGGSATIMPGQPGYTEMFTERLNTAMTIEEEIEKIRIVFQSLSRVAPGYFGRETSDEQGYLFNITTPEGWTFLIRPEDHQVLLVAETVVENAEWETANVVGFKLAAALDYEFTHAPQAPSDEQIDRDIEEALEQDSMMEKNNDPTTQLPDGTIV